MGYSVFKTRIKKEATRERGVANYKANRRMDCLFIVSRYWLLRTSLWIDWHLCAGSVPVVGQDVPGNEITIPFTMDEGGIWVKWF